MLNELRPILVVEDDEIYQEIFKRKFESEGVSNPVIEAYDGVEALEILAEGNHSSKPCIIVLDINMPRMNGFEFLREMRSDDSMKKNIVFVASSSSRDEDIKTAYDLCAAGYFDKDNLDGLVRICRDFCAFNEFPA